MIITAHVLFSCYNSDNTNSEADSNTLNESLLSITDPYYYYGMNRINMLTGAITSLCTDPLCDHKTDSCPLYYYDPYR